MHLHMYTFMFVNTEVCIYEHMYTCIISFSVHVCMYVCICMYVCMCVCMYLCLYACTYVCIFKYKYLSLKQYVHVYL